jgi:adenosylcobinamide-GDP ribazoletransferase
VNAFFAALQFLTVIPRPTRMEYSGSEAGPAAIFFPVVGLLLGGVLVLMNAALEPFVTGALSCVSLVAVLAVLTRGLHLDGLADTFDGLGAGGSRERMLEVMQDSHNGAFGTIAIVVVLLLKIHAIDSIDAERWRALIAAPVLGRWAMVLLGYRAQAVKPGLGATLVTQLGSHHLACATLLAATFTVASSRGRGLLAIALVAMLSFAAKIYFQHRLGGVNGDIFGAIGELSETSVLVLFAVMDP